MPTGVPSGMLRGKMTAQGTPLTLAPELAVDEVGDPPEEEAGRRRRGDQVREVQERDPLGAGEPGDGDGDADDAAVARHPPSQTRRMANGSEAKLRHPS